MRANIVVLGGESAVVDLDGVRNPTVRDALIANGGGAALSQPGSTFEEAAICDYGSLDGAGSITLNGEDADQGSRLPADATIVIARNVKGG